MWMHGWYWTSISSIDKFLRSKRSLITWPKLNKSQDMADQLIDGQRSVDSGLGWCDRCSTKWTAKCFRKSDGLWGGLSISTFMVFYLDARMTYWELDLAVQTESRCGTMWNGHHDVKQRPSWNCIEIAQGIASDSGETVALLDQVFFLNQPHKSISSMADRHGPKHPCLSAQLVSGSRVWMVGGFAGTASEISFWTQSMGYWFIYVYLIYTMKYTISFSVHI